MADNDAGWVPRPHPESVLYVEQQRGRGGKGERFLVGTLRGVVVRLRNDGTYTRRNRDGSYSTGRWSA